jgi:hypothetical protein
MKISETTYLVILISLLSIPSLRAITDPCDAPLRNSSTASVENKKGFINPILEAKIADLAKNYSTISQEVLFTEIVKIVDSFMPEAFLDGSVKDSDLGAYVNPLTKVEPKEELFQITLFRNDKVKRNWLGRQVYDGKPLKFSFNVWYPRFEGRALPQRYDLNEGIKLLNLNWAELATETGIVKRLTLLIDRDKEARFYDRGSRYQEISFSFNSSGRLSAISIANGNYFVFGSRFQWADETIEFRDKIVLSPAAYIGEPEVKTIED